MNKYQSNQNLVWPVLFPENLPELQPFLEATTTIYDRLGHPIPKIVSHRAMIIVAIKEGLITPSDDLLYFLNLTAQDLVEMGIYSPLHPVNHVKQYNFGGFCPQYVQYVDRTYPYRHFADTIKSSIAPSAKFDIEPEPNELKAEFLKLYHVKQYNGEMYIFCHNHYRKISQRELTQIIYGTFRNVVQRLGSSDFVENVYRELVRDPALVIGDKDICKTMVAFKNCYFDFRRRTFKAINPDDVMFYAINANFRCLTK